MSQEAVEFKNQGNKAFSGGDFPGAVDLYTKAIKINDQEPAFFTNRAQVRALKPPHILPTGRIWWADWLRLDYSRHTSKLKRTAMQSLMQGKRLR